MDAARDTSTGCECRNPTGTLPHQRHGAGCTTSAVCRQALVHRVLFGQFNRHAHEVQTEHAHPAGRVRLLQYDAALKLFAAINHRDVVESEKAALENVISLTIDFVHPPREVDEQLVKTFFEPRTVGHTAAYAIHVVYAPGGPRI